MQRHLIQFKRRSNEEAGASNIRFKAAQALPILMTSKLGVEPSNEPNVYGIGNHPFTYRKRESIAQVTPRYLATSQPLTGIGSLKPERDSESIVSNQCSCSGKNFSSTIQRKVRGYE